MSADPQHGTPDPESHPGQQRQEVSKHPFNRALETWDAWSMADTMRRALQRAREQGDHETVATFERYPEWTQGPGPLEALRANRELVETLTGWQWQAMRAARQQGRGWHEIAAALGLEADRTDLPAALACGADVARRAYLGAIQRQQRISDRLPPGLLRYDPRWRELAEPNPADRAHQHGRVETGREGGHERC
jgi:hypothetical protein